MDPLCYMIRAELNQDVQKNKLVTSDIIDNNNQNRLDFDMETNGGDRHYFHISTEGKMFLE
jgi:hypothetical protein